MAWPRETIRVGLRLAAVVGLAAAVTACQSFGGGTTVASNSPAAATASTAAEPPPVQLGALPFFPREAEEKAFSAVVVDVKANEVLHEEDGQGLRYPASLTKMMTLYLLFEELEAGRLSRNSLITASQNAAAMPPSKLGLKPGDQITVDLAIRALAVRSANDVSVAVAEQIAGSERAFVDRMNRKARELGMRRTVFNNPHGLPDPKQISTALDMAILARALQTQFPRHYGYFSLRSYEYGGRTFRATNKLLGEVAGVDGIKTGYIRASGYNLAASVRRNGRHLIVVVIGGKTGRERDARITELIETYLPRAVASAAPPPGAL